MTPWFAARVFMLCAAFMASISCTPQQEPFISVEVCLNDAAGVAEFKQEISTIARAQGMSVFDDSARAEKDVEALVTDEFRRKVGRPVVSMVIRYEDDVMAMVGNIGLPSGQVLVSFFDHPASFDSRQFADMVTKRLAKTWRTEVVPPGHGALGMEGCMGAVEPSEVVTPPAPES
jgi:hypothetical protein